MTANRRRGPPPRIADKAFINGFIHTLAENLPSAEALAIQAGEIIAVGHTRTIEKCCNDATEIIDLGGRMLMPGLIDGHCHPTKGAIAELFSCKFAFTATAEDVAIVLRERIAAEPDGAWIIGGRWGSDFFTANEIASPRAWLDQHSGDKAVYLRDDSGHNAWVNSRALARLNISRASRDPAGGKIVREPHSKEPNGLLFEAADSAARAQLPDWTDEQYRRGVIEMMRIANAYGITGVVDADASEPLLDAYQRVARDVGLSLHVVASISTPYGHRDKALDYARIEALRDRYASLHVDTRFAKIYQDGVPTAARTAAMLEPYIADETCEQGYRGLLHVDEKTLTTDIAELEKRGFTVKLHTAGDRSIRTALDAIEKAHAISGRSDLRHELAHAGFIADADVGRLRELNVTADLSPYLWYPSPIVGSIRAAVGTRADRYWPIRDLLEAGATVMAGSDWPAAVASMDPWIGIHAMVTRRDPTGVTPGALWPEQAISLPRALKIFTVDGARAMRLEAQTGSIAVGKRADLIVLDRNILETPSDEIAKTQVLLTMFGGEIVYRAGSGALCKP